MVSTANPFQWHPPRAVWLVAWNLTLYSSQVPTAILRTHGGSADTRQTSLVPCLKGQEDFVESSKIMGGVEVLSYKHTSVRMKWPGRMEVTGNFR
jgi:hypothetical protein